MLEIKLRKKLDVNGVAEISGEKKKLKKTDWKIVKRLVLFLYYNNKIKRTALAMKCNMSYDKCMLYIDWLSNMRFINKQTDEKGFELICLNDKGKDLYELVKDSENEF